MSESDWQQGYVHVYTGDGKGKTTAALGLALRAAGAGFKVFIGQFIKGTVYSEMNALRCLSDSITLEQFGRGCFISRDPAPEDIEAARQGLAVALAVIQKREYRLVILDEINVAVQCKLFPAEEVLALIDAKPAQVELILTGRGAPPEVLERADLVTEMREVKHYYRSGVAARIGIER